MLKFLVVVLVFAALVYAVMWALERRRAGRSGSSGESAGRRRRRNPGPTRQVAPDDDEDFLRWLDRKRRKDSPEQ